jgi:CheY-like chemotaxis protein
MFDYNALPNGDVVLLVDDEDAIRRLVRHILESMGYTVLDACNGKDGLALCQSHQGVINLLITDVVMPELGGRELAAAALKLRPELVVVMMSGYSQEDVFDKRVHPGTAFLQKPFTSSALQQVVRATIASAAAA